MVIFSISRSLKKKIYKNGEDVSFAGLCTKQACALTSGEYVAPFLKCFIFCWGLFQGIIWIRLGICTHAYVTAVQFSSAVDVMSAHISHFLDSKILVQFDSNLEAKLLRAGIHRGRLAHTRRSCNQHGVTQRLPSVVLCPGLALEVSTVPRVCTRGQLLLVQPKVRHMENSGKILSC